MPSAGREGRNACTPSSSNDRFRAAATTVQPCLSYNRCLHTWQCFPSIKEHNNTQSSLAAHRNHERHKKKRGTIPTERTTTNTTARSRHHRKELQRSTPTRVNKSAWSLNRTIGPLSPFFALHRHRHHAPLPPPRACPYPWALRTKSGRQALSWRCTPFPAFGMRVLACPRVRNGSSGAWLRRRGFARRVELLSRAFPITSHDAVQQVFMCSSSCKHMGSISISN